MKKKILKSFICFLLAIVMLTECNLQNFVSFAAEVNEEQIDIEEGMEIEDSEEDSEEEEFMPTSNNYLYPFEEAVIALEELAKENVLQGVIYLADEVIMRMLPEIESEPMKILYSGDVVNILGVGQDAGYQIWYRVSYENDYEKVIGYVPHDNLVSVNYDFMKWQENYVRSIGMFSRMRASYMPADISSFPQSYQEGLSALKAKHPNWIFVKLNTNVNWETMLKRQEGDRSWIYSVGIPASWKNGDTKTTNWAYASRGIIRHYMDPRNWFSEEYVFQFELLGYEASLHTVEAVEKMLSGSFMANTLIDDKMTYAQAFVQIGRSHDISPMFLAARVIQEQGYQGKGDLISGKYPNYENYYNYFNIQASGNGDKETIENGLKYAKEKGWNTRYKALEAGIKFLLTNYIKAGQNTLYLQKFDTVGEIATHQYMQNIKAPAQESSIVHKGYNNSGLLSQPFVFVIPVYENMPAKAAAKPGQEDKISLNTTEINNLQVDSEVTLQPLVNGNIVEGARFEFTSSNPEIATIDSTGKITALKAGEITITCRDMDDPENPNVGTCKVTVIPADIDLANLKLPELKAIVYHPNKTLKDVKLPKGYAWVNPEIVPCVEQSSYAVVYNPDEEKYNSITFNLDLEVKKKALELADCTLPTDLYGAAGAELSSIALPAGFYWNDPTLKLPDTIGTKECIASYNMDTSNYETLENIKLKVTIVCEKHKMSEWKITEATCEEDGSKVRNCIVCGYKEELLLEKKVHLYQSEITKEATEEAEGIRTYICQNCDGTYTESIPKLPATHKHKYEEEITKKASCTEDGLKSFICSCKDSYTEIIEASGHKMNNGRCQNCGYTETVETPKQEEVAPTPKPEENVQTPSKPENKEEEGVKNPTNNEDKKEETVQTPPKSENKEEEGVKNPTNNEDKKEETGQTPSKPENKEEEDVKNPVINEDKKEETVQTPSKPENKEEEGVKNPVINEDKKEETVQTPLKSENKEKEGVQSLPSNENKKEESEKVELKTEENTDKTTVENKAELELMSNLVEMASKNETDGEKQTVAIQLNKNTEISQKIVEMAKEHGVDLEVSLPNELKWTIKSDSLGDGMPSTIDLNAQIVSEVIEKAVIETVVTEHEYMELSLSHDGEFGFEGTLTIPVEEDLVGQIANLFYFNEKLGELEFQMATRVEKNKQINLEFNHASDYVIVFANKSMEQVESMDEKDKLETNVVMKEESETRTNEKTDGLNKLLVIFFVIMLVSGSIAVIGYFLYHNGKKVNKDINDLTFEEWLKEEPQKQTKEVETKRKTNEFLDDDVDDYREKETLIQATNEKTSIHLKKDIQDYLDDDVDDYKEKM